MPPAPDQPLMTTIRTRASHHRARHHHTEPRCSKLTTAQLSISRYMYTCRPAHVAARLGGGEDKYVAALIWINSSPRTCGCLRVSTPPRTHHTHAHTRTHTHTRAARSRTRRKPAPYPPVSPATPIPVERCRVSVYHRGGDGSPHQTQPRPMHAHLAHRASAGLRRRAPPLHRCVHAR
jgi:hypothetical protein